MSNSQKCLFNSRILEGSIRDAASRLPAEYKADVLLHAIEYLDLKEDGARNLVENAIGSCLLIPDLSPKNIVRARILRAKSALVVGQHDRADADLREIVAIDPEHSEARQLVTRGSRVPDLMDFMGDQSGLRLSTEVYYEIALRLTRIDLRKLLHVPGVLSRIASEILFRTIDLHFDEDADAARKSAALLGWAATNPVVAARVRCLRIFASHSTSNLAFQMVILLDSLPKLVNLRKAHIRLRNNDLSAVLDSLYKNQPFLRELSIDCIDDPGEKMQFPEFDHLKTLAFFLPRVPQAFEDYIINHQITLRSLRGTWRFPADRMFTHNLIHLDLQGLFTPEAFTAILSNSHQLQLLRISGRIRGNPTSCFKDNIKSLPFLRHFALSITDAGNPPIVNQDLFPAVVDMLRGRTRLQHLTLKAADRKICAICGFTAVVWGVLPSLTGLESLIITLPSDVAPSLAMWLIPRTVNSLALFHVPPQSPDERLIAQLGPGVPPGLRVLSLSASQIEPFRIVRLSFPMIKVLCVDQLYFTVIRRDDPNQEDGVEALELEPWPLTRAEYHRKEWFRYFDCHVEDSFDFES